MSFVPTDGPLGRDRELDEVERFLDLVPSGLAALALTGPAGIGKTTVWREGVHRAASRGYLLLTTRPSQAERSLSFAGLADLLESVPGAAFDALAPLQRHAIDVALMRAEPDAKPVAGAVPAALLAVLRQAALAGPVLIAVDDAQWLDDATAESLPFALRRLEQLPVGVLVSVRLDQGRPATFEAAISAERRRDLVLGPLSVAALHGILRQRLQRTLPRPTLVRLATSCGGNPFYALEIARELERVGIPVPGHPLPVPGELQALVRSRMARLPRRTRDALLTAACLSQPSTATVDLDALGPAERAGIVLVETTGRLRFAHPLLVAAVQDSAPASQRLATHRRLAELTTDPEERARHLAAATTVPDDSVADALDTAAEQAARRGALTAACQLARRALELTQDRASERATRRAMTFAGHCVLSGGDPGEAKEVLESALRACPPGNLRAEVLTRLSWTSRENRSQADEAYQRLLEALAQTTDRTLAARIHAQAIWMAQDDTAHGIRHCSAALALIDETADPATYAQVVMHRAYLRLISGGGADDAAIARGKAIEDREVRAGLTDRSPVPTIWPLLKDDFTKAVEVHTDHLEWSRQVGQLPLELSLTYFLSCLELWRGDWDRARRWSNGLAELLEQSESDFYRCWSLTARGMVDAHTGRLGEAAAAGSEALRVATATADQAKQADARQLLGFVALSDGDLAAAAEHLLAADRILERLGQREPAQYRFQADLVEALVGLGDLDGARSQVGRLAERARVFGRPWTVALHARSRGLLLAAQGDLDGAASALREALDYHQHLEMPFERARTLLICGQVLRRRNERKQARAALTEALSGFAALGAATWARRARDELARVPARRISQGLTATEAEIARLAASGLTNRQIADRAFVTPKTVEANLSRAYAKLGVQSRTQLVRAIAELDRTGPPGSANHA
jgi:DNA-binding CsgD family transcriptional regulator